MDHDFWLGAWRDGRTNFHREEPHPHLAAHAARVFPAGETVLVPLCGATHDLRWLAEHGWRALGVELSPLACERLAAREGLTPVDPLGPFRRWTGPRVTLLQGDFFALTPELAGPIGGIWDRAALIALHPSQRAGYVGVQRALLGRGGLLLSTLAYDPAVMDGPPWSTDGEAVATLWPEAVRIAEATEPAPPRFRERGLRELTDLLFAIPPS